MQPKHPVSKVFGETLRRIRLNSGLTQEQLAELSNCHPNYIGAVERGERNITIIKAVDISKALNCSINCLFDGL